MTCDPHPLLSAVASRLKAVVEPEAAFHVIRAVELRLGDLFIDAQDTVAALKTTSGADHDTFADQGLATGSVMVTLATGSRIEHANDDHILVVRFTDPTEPFEPECSCCALAGCTDPACDGQRRTRFAHYQAELADAALDIVALAAASGTPVTTSAFAHRTTFNDSHLAALRAALGDEPARVAVHAGLAVAEDGDA